MNVKMYVMALLCLFLSIISIPIFSQEVQPLKVGDTLPDELWKLPLQVVNHPDGKETITLSEYKGKLIILDFWATWCSPCVAMLPKMDSLQKEFRDKIQILPVAYQSANEISSFMEKYTKMTGRNISLTEVVEDKTLHDLFPHTYIPHYVWVVDGTVTAITGTKEITKENITSLLTKQRAQLTTKTDLKLVQFDYQKPFLVNGNGGDERNMIYHTVFTRYIEGLKSGYYTKREAEAPFLTSKITIRNLALPQIFALAHGEGKIYLGINRMIYETADSSSLRGDGKIVGENYWEWARQHTFCYEIIVPRGLESEIYKIMIRDFNNLVPYTATVQSRKSKFYALERTSGQDMLKSKGGQPICKVDPFGAEIRNQSLGQLYGRLNAQYLQKLAIPFINRTGYTENVDIEFSANMSSIESLNEALAPYHLTIREREGEIPMLVISDKNSDVQNHLLPISIKQ